MEHERGESDAAGPAGAAGRRGASTSARADSRSEASSPVKPPVKAPVKPRGRPPPRSKLSRPERVELFDRLRRQRPAPAPELTFTDPYTLLVAVTLSAQATDRGVNRATRTLFAAAPDPARMVALGVDGVGEHVRTIGLWRGKARNVVALSEALLRDHAGEVPRDRDALVALPGVGRKTANVVLNLGFGEPTMPVDTHVLRLANRIGLAPGKTPEIVERGLERAVPPEFAVDAHHWLILHGRYVCRARRPLCEHCVIADLCRFKERTARTPAAIAEASPNGPPPGVPDVGG